MKNKAIELRKEGDAEADNRCYDSAVKKYMLSIDTYPEYYVAHVHLAKKVFLELNNPDEAIKYCQEALKIAGGDYPYAYRVEGDAHKLKTAILLSKTKDITEITKQYEQAEFCYNAILQKEQHIAEKRLQDLYALKPLIDSISKDSLSNKSTADNSEERDEDPFEKDTEVKNYQYNQDDLYKALSEKNTELVNNIIKSININIKDEHGLTPLYKAALHNNIAAVKVLLEHGANPNLPCRAGLTALHVAAENGNREILETLVTRNGKMDLLNNNKSSLLHSAAIGIKDGKDNFEVIKWILDHKDIADPFLENSRGQTPRDILESYDYSYAEKYDDILELLGYYTHSSEDT